MSDTTNPSPSGTFAFTSMGAVKMEIVKSSWVPIPDDLWQDLTNAARHFTGRPNTEKASLDFSSAGGPAALQRFADQVRTYVDRVNGNVPAERAGQHLSASVTPYMPNGKDAVRKDPVLGKDGKQATRQDKDGKTQLVWTRVLLASHATFRIAWHKDSDTTVDTQTVTTTTVS